MTQGLAHLIPKTNRNGLETSHPWDKTNCVKGPCSAIMTYSLPNLKMLGNL